MPAADRPPWAARPPHPATVVQSKPSIGPPARPPHPATLAQPRSAIGVPVVRPPQVASLRFTSSQSGTAQRAAAAGGGAAAHEKQAPKTKELGDMTVAVWNVKDLTFDNLKTNKVAGGASPLQMICTHLAKVDVMCLLEPRSNPDMIAKEVIKAMGSGNTWNYTTAFAGQEGSRLEYYVCFYNTVRWTFKGAWVVEKETEASPLDLHDANEKATPQSRKVGGRTPVVLRFAGINGTYTAKRGALIAFWHAIGPGKDKDPSGTYLAYRSVLTKYGVKLVLGDFNYESGAASAATVGGTSLGGSAYDRIDILSGNMSDVVTAEPLRAGGASDHLGVKAVIKTNL